MLVVVLGVFNSATWAALAATGVDVSRWQHGQTLNWSKVEADGISFAFIKATEGSGYTNPYFASDWAATGKLGIYHGAYHFARPSVGSAADQAKYFVKVAGLQSGTGVLPPVLDLEVTGGLGVSKLRTWTSNWLQTVENLTGRVPLIYVSPSFWEGPLGNSTAFHHYPLWIAHYGVSSPRVPGGWPTWTFWQTTSSGSVDGIAGNVDINKFNGTTTQLARVANVTGGSSTGGTTGTTPPPGPAPTTLTLAAGRSGVYAGASVTLSGRLRSAQGGVADRTVTLWRQNAGATTAKKIMSTQTGDIGHYAFRVSPTATASYVAKWAGGKIYLPAVSPAVTVSLLEAAPTKLTMTTTRSLVYPGQDVTASGRLTSASGGVADRPVNLWRQDEGATTATKIRTTRTDTTGRYTFLLAPTHTASYVARWKGGSMYSASASPPRTVTYKPTVPTTLTLASNRSGAYSGQSVDLSGALTSATGAVAGQDVELFRQRQGSEISRHVATLTTDSKGGFSTAVEPTTTASYTIRYAGAPTYDPAASSPLQVDLLRPEPSTLDLKSWRSTLPKGRTMTVHGHLLNAVGSGIARREIVVYRRLAGDDTWVRATSDRTNLKGYWRADVAPRRDVVFKAVWPGGMRYRPATSTRLRVNVV